MLVITGVLQVSSGQPPLYLTATMKARHGSCSRSTFTVWGRLQLLTGILSVGAGYGALRGLTWRG